MPSPTTHQAENVSQTSGTHGLKIESGEFTPTLTTSNGDMSGVSYGARQGTYIKINDMVWFKIALSIDGITNKGTGSVQVTGLPFTAEGGSSLLNTSASSIGFFSLAASSSVNARGAITNAYVRLITGAGSMSVSELGTNGILTISAVYKAS